MESKKEKNQKAGIYDNKYHKNRLGRNNRQRIWKIVAISVILIFAVLVAGGLIKAHYIMSSLVTPTQAQIDYAMGIAAEKSKLMGINQSAFHVDIGRKMRIFHKENSTRTIIQVSFYNSTTTHTFLIDISSGKVLLHSGTEVYEQLENRRGQHDNRNILGLPIFEHPR